MKKLLVVLLAAALTSGLVGTAMAVSDTAIQSVTITVEEIAQLAVSGSPGTFTLSNAATVAGSLPDAQEEATTSLSWTSNVSSGTRKITAQLDADYTTGIVLKATVTVDAASNGRTGGQKTLSFATAEEMVTGITNENVTGNTVTYEASASTMIAPVASESKTVIWTLTETQ